LAQSQGADGLEAHHLVHAHGEFDKDFGVDEWHGTNAFIRNGDRVFRTYFINNRGDEQMGSTWNYLDITALGRQEEWRTRRRAILRPRRTSGGSGTMNTPTPNCANGGAIATRTTAIPPTRDRGAVVRRAGRRSNRQCKPRRRNKAFGAATEICVQNVFSRSSFY
jgi:hypothetical protein